MSAPELATERIGLLVYRLALGDRLTVADAAALLGVTPNRARKVLNLASRVIPIFDERDGSGPAVWRLLTREESW